MSSDHPTLHIIGAGRVGSTLGRAWHTAELLDIDLVINNRLLTAQQAVAWMGAGQACERDSNPWLNKLKDQQNQPHWIMLAVPDGNLTEVVNQLADELRHLAKPELVFHVSGQIGVSVLEPLEKLGIRTACVHPILAFSQPSIALTQLAGSHCLVTANTDNYSSIESLFSAIGVCCHAAPQSLDRRKYHAAMVAVSNFTCGLHYLALDLAQESGLSSDIAHELLTNLAQRSLAGVTRYGALSALTGPIERGDKIAIKALLKVFDDQPIVHATALRALADVVEEMAERKQSSGGLVVDESKGT